MLTFIKLHAIHYLCICVFVLQILITPWCFKNNTWHTVIITVITMRKYWFSLLMISCVTIEEHSTCVIKTSQRWRKNEVSGAQWPPWLLLVHSDSLDLPRWYWLEYVPTLTKGLPLTVGFARRNPPAALEVSVFQVQLP